MSLSLRQGTDPHGLEVKSWGKPVNLGILIGDYTLSMADFLDMVEYVLTNTDLEPNDLRPGFLARMQNMKVVEGYNPGGRRLTVD